MPRKKRPEGTRAPNGASSIYYSEYDGKWHGRVTVGVRANGKPDRRHVKYATESAVISAVRELERQRDTGRVRNSGPVWTVEKWLVHWVENIAAATVRPNTMVGYRTSVYRHANPGIGAHRIDKLMPEHLEALYRKMVASGLKPGTAHLAHRTIRAALNEAVRRGYLVHNPATVAKAPRVEDDEVIPFTRAEARSILAATDGARNGARFLIAMALGLRRGEALGLRWSDIAIRWRHGCEDSDDCRTILSAEKCAARRGSGRMTIRRAIQQRTWQHGCRPAKSCGKNVGAACPDRHGGGLVAAEVKSRAGRRAIGLPHQVVVALVDHRERQAAERETAANLWTEGGWMFANRVGGPVHPTEDHRAWKALLRVAGVRDARLHDARHTAATMLLVLGVPLVAVMELMGWSNPAVAKRYMHVTDEVINAVADQVSGHLWADPDDDQGDDEAGPGGVRQPA